MTEKLTPEQEQYNQRFLIHNNNTLKNRVNNLLEEVINLETHLRIANEALAEYQKKEQKEFEKDLNKNKSKSKEK